ncbi:MAG: recombinase family protein [Deltaproteobacteria bacterium]|nr:recombinase family protein [Deltaproteobacteria bacterium]
MDDFLYNLRRDTDKRNRRHQGQGNYRGPDRRDGKDVRKGGYHRRNEASDQLLEQIGGVLPEIKTLLEGISENQKRLAAAEERKADAFESIIEVTREFVKTRTVTESSPKADVSRKSDTAAPVASPQPTPVPEAEPDAEKKDEAILVSDRGKITKVALRLRKKGKTYKEIAQYLEAEKYPTFSGKGAWHAQTVHKLCN